MTLVGCWFWFPIASYRYLGWRLRSLLLHSLAFSSFLKSLPYLCCIFLAVFYPNLLLQHLQGHSCWSIQLSPRSVRFTPIYWTHVAQVEQRHVHHAVHPVPEISPPRELSTEGTSWFPHFISAVWLPSSPCISHRSLEELVDCAMTAVIRWMRISRLQLAVDSNVESNIKARGKVA